MQTIQDWREGRFTCPDDAVKNSLNYLDRTAGEFQVDISGVTVEDFLKNTVLGEERSINGFLIKFIQSKELPQIPEGTLTKLNSALKGTEIMYVENKLYALKLKVDTATTRAKGFYKEFENELKSLDDAKKALDGFKSGWTYFEQIQRIHAAGFWKFHDFVYGTAYFDTVNPIRLREEALKIDINMGFYTVTFQPESKKFRVSCKSGNAKTSDGFFHPYISRDGEVCWGNAAERAQKLFTENNLEEIMKLLANIMSFYHTDSTPWRRLKEFVPAKIGTTQDVPTAETEEEFEQEPVCETCENVESECECSYCETCDVRYHPDNGHDGNYCPECDTCTGSEPCETHYCSICEEYSLRDGVCRDHCCTGCERTERDINNRGHASNCSQYLVETTNN